MVFGWVAWAFGVVSGGRGEKLDHTNRRLPGDSVGSDEIIGLEA